MNGDLQGIEDTEPFVVSFIAVGSANSTCSNAGSIPVEPT